MFAKNEKIEIEMRSVIPNFVFFRNMKKRKNWKASSVYAILCFPFGVIQLGKQIRNPAIICSFADNN